MVDAADAERRRLERDLHDGTQQRLVSLAMNLGMARAQATTADQARLAIADAHEEAKAALLELRHLIRGLHPAVLEDRGLDAALSGVAARMPVPVRLTGLLHVDTGGGPVVADDVSAAAATIITRGGDARIVFATAPDTVLVNTDGAATLAVPGGPYAVTANSDGGPQLVSIATDPAAGRSITVTTGGGPLLIEPVGSAS